MDGQRSGDDHSRHWRHISLHHAGRTSTCDFDLDTGELDNLHPDCECPNHGPGNRHLYGSSLDGHQHGDGHAGRKRDPNRFRRTYFDRYSDLDPNHRAHNYDNSADNRDHYSDDDLDSGQRHNGDYYVYRIRELLKGFDSAASQETPRSSEIHLRAFEGNGSCARLRFRLPCEALNFWNLSLPFPVGNGLRLPFECLCDTSELTVSPELASRFFDYLRQVVYAGAESRLPDVVETSSTYLKLQR